MIRYFDASALVKKYVDEEGSELVQNRLHSGSVATSRLSEVEISSALARRCREGSISESDRDRALDALRKDFQAFIKIELSPQVVSRARGLLVDHPLRASDAIQLASCLLLRDRGVVLEFFAFDKKLNSVAQAEGLKVGILDSVAAPTVLPTTKRRRAERILESTKQGVLRNVMALTARPEVLSLAVGIPAPELFPMAELAQATTRMLTKDPGSLQYGLPHQPLKAQIVELMAMRGVRCSAEQVFLTAGSQQAMDLLCRMLLEPGAQVLIEETVYDGIQMAIKRQEPEILTVSTDPHTGIDVDQVESLLVRGVRPCFIYVITDGHNPLGVSMSVEKRHRLVELARTYGVPILEDDAYGFLYYDKRPAPPLRALDEKWVFYLGSFSKILAPALRAGWTVVPEELAPRLSMLKHAADLDTPSFSHRTISSYLESGYLPTHIESIRDEYRRRRDAILKAMDDHFPKEVRWHHLSSGMFVWAELPREMDATVLLRAAVETENVAFTPGTAFAANGSSHANHCMRLSFGNNPPARLEEGIRRLGRVIKAMLPTGNSIGVDV